LRSWQAGHSTLHPRLPWRCVSIAPVYACCVVGLLGVADRHVVVVGCAWVCDAVCVPADLARAFIVFQLVSVALPVGVLSPVQQTLAEPRRQYRSTDCGYIRTPCIHDQRTKANRHPPKFFFFFRYFLPLSAIRHGLLVHRYKDISADATIRHPCARIRGLAVWFRFRV
jgi:hypothetical protein